MEEPGKTAERRLLEQVAELEAALTCWTNGPVFRKAVHRRLIGARQLRKASRGGLRPRRVAFQSEVDNSLHG
jgi:hypothetical protein